MQQYYFSCTKTNQNSQIIFISSTENQGNGQKGQIQGISNENTRQGIILDEFRGINNISPVF